MDNVRTLQGPIGPPGLNCSQGPIGRAGPPGFNGTQGPQGIIGPQGFNGSQGPPGSTGPQGFQGAGNFSQCVHNTSSNSGSQNKVTDNSRVGSVSVTVEERSVSVLNALKLMISERNGSQLGKILKNWFMLSLRISSYGCTREVWRPRKKRKSCSRRWPRATLASFLSALETSQVHP